MFALILRVGARNEDTSVHEESGLGVVHAGDGGGVENRHALVRWASGIVEDGLEVGVIRKPESSNTLHRARR